MSRVVSDGEVSPPRGFPRSRSAGYNTQSHRSALVEAEPAGQSATMSLQADIGARLARRRTSTRPLIRTVQEGHQLMEEEAAGTEYSSDFSPAHTRGHQRRYSVPVATGHQTSPLRNNPSVNHNVRHGRSDSTPLESERSRTEPGNNLQLEKQARRAMSETDAGYGGGGGRPSVIRIQSDGAGRKDSMEGRSPPAGSGSFSGPRISPSKADHVQRVIELIDAVRNDHLEAINVILQQAPSRTALLNSVHPGTGRTALHEAVISCSIDAVALLLEWGADPDCRHSSQMPPLMYAVKTGDDRMVKLLLNNGADIHAQDLKQCTALHYACAAGHRSIIKILLVRGANMYARNRDGLFPQQLASTERIRTLFRKLHEYHEMYNLVDNELETSDKLESGLEAEMMLNSSSPSSFSPPASPPSSGNMNLDEEVGLRGIRDTWNPRKGSAHENEGLHNGMSLTALSPTKGLSIGDRRKNNAFRGDGRGEGDGQADEDDASPRELLESNENMFQRAWENDRDDDQPSFSWSQHAQSDVEGSGGRQRHVRNSRTLSVESVGPSYSRRIVQAESMSDVEGGAYGNRAAASRGPRPRNFSEFRLGIHERGAGQAGDKKGPQQSGRGENLEFSRLGGYESPGSNGHDRQRRSLHDGPAGRNRRLEIDVGQPHPPETKRGERGKVAFQEEVGSRAQVNVDVEKRELANGGHEYGGQQGGRDKRMSQQEDRHASRNEGSGSQNGVGGGMSATPRHLRDEQLKSNHRHSNSDEQPLEFTRRLRDSQYSESDSEIGARRRNTGNERTGPGLRYSVRSSPPSEHSRFSNSRETMTDDESSGSLSSVSNGLRSGPLISALRSRVATPAGPMERKAAKAAQKVSFREKKSVKFDLPPKDEADVDWQEEQRFVDEDGDMEAEIRGKETATLGKENEEDEEEKAERQESSPSGDESKAKVTPSASTKSKVKDGGQDVKKKIIVSEEDLNLIRPDWRVDAAIGGCVACGQLECDCKLGSSSSIKADKKKSESRSSPGGKESDAEKPSLPSESGGGAFENAALSSRNGALRWTKGELLGEGAYGKVFLGLNQTTGELMAVKQIKMSQGDEKAMHIAALEREIVLYRKMRHRHIVGYIDMEREEETGSIYVFLEFVSGGSIHSLLEKFGKFSESLVRVYTRQLLLGLEYLHKCKIIHRDIKGGNVLVDRDGVVKLADFGASKAFHEGTLTEGCKSIRGSVFWMAPEVIKGDGYGRKADIWSVGCTVIEMLTGSHPWPQMDNTWTAIFHIAKTTTGPPIPDECSEEGRDFLNVCFQLDPKLRPVATELLHHPFVQVPDTPREARFGTFSPRN